MGTNYYFMSRNKELMQTCFAKKSEWGVLGEEYTSWMSHILVIGVT